MRRIWCSMPIEEARRQKRSPPGFRTRQVPRSMARNWSSPRAKWSTALLSTTSANALGKDISSMASTRKLPGGSSGARDAARRRDYVRRADAGGTHQVRGGLDAVMVMLQIHPDGIEPHKARHFVERGIDVDRKSV